MFLSIPETRRSESAFLQALKEPVARKAIRYLKSHAPDWLGGVTVVAARASRLRHRFWQPGGGDHRNITSIEVLRAVIDYIHANPVRRGLVARAEDWEWSSAALVRGTAAGETGNGPRAPGRTGTRMTWRWRSHALRSTSGRHWVACPQAPKGVVTVKHALRSTSGRATRRRNRPPPRRGRACPNLLYEAGLYRYDDATNGRGLGKSPCPKATTPWTPCAT